MSRPSLFVVMMAGQTRGVFIVSRSGNNIVYSDSAAFGVIAKDTNITISGGYGVSADLRKSLAYRVPFIKLIYFQGMCLTVLISFGRFVVSLVSFFLKNSFKK